MFDRRLLQYFDWGLLGLASIIGGIGLFTLVGHILVTTTVPELATMSSLEIAVWILLALTVSELSKVLWQIWYYRAGA